MRGEKLVQLRFEAEVEVKIRNREKRNSDMGLCETHQELESKRLQLQQANQRTDQAQREKIKIVWRSGNEE